MNDLFPKFVITPVMVSLVAAICERLGRLHGTFRRDLRLRRINRIRTIQASLQIEGNVLTVEQVTAVLERAKTFWLRRAMCRKFAMHLPLMINWTPGMPLRLPICWMPIKR